MPINGTIQAKRTTGDVGGNDPPPPAYRLFQTALYGGTILVSAFLLFWVQPLFARMILPVLGGSSAVWTTVMLFFQAALLAGYLYAHWISRFIPLGRQLGLHLALLGAGFLSLPFTLDYATVDDPAGAPIRWLLAFAAASLGLPFFTISASAPLLQRWFSLTRHRDRHNPYFLYGASNLGSMAALFAFPLVIEPAVGVREQALWWRAAYGILVALFTMCALITWRDAKIGKGSTDGESPSSTSATKQEAISSGLRLSWLFLAFIPSSLMLGLTSHVTTDVAPVSMFWVVPLALYLLSFVLVFSRWRRLVANRLMAGVIVLSAAALLALRLAGFSTTLDATMVTIPLHTLFFFTAALLCHGCLSDTRPAAAQLTEFYLWLSIGGMLGGVFNAVIAPFLFNQVYEYYAAILPAVVFALRILMVPRQNAASLPKIVALMAGVFAAATLLLLIGDTLLSRPITSAARHGFLLGSLAVLPAAWGLARTGKVSRRIAFLVALVALLGNIPVQLGTHANLLLARSFYGSLRVKLRQDADGTPYHLFIHGSTRHNIQQTDPESREQPEPLMYYNRLANIGQAMESLKSHLCRPVHLGVVGLGAGAASAYLAESDTATFYEIDREVVDMATDARYFTYLEASRGRKKIVVGDARLQLRKAPEKSFDILLIDAFSSDAIPVHLLTAEALALYLDKLKDDGALILHLSNRYLDLKKVVQGYRLPTGHALYYASKQGVAIPVAPEGEELPRYFFSHSQVAVIARASALPAEITGSERWQKLARDPDLPEWTDDYSNVLGVLRIGDE